MTEKHNTSLHEDGGKPVLTQARCSCGWQTGYMFGDSAKREAKKHRAENR